MNNKLKACVICLIALTLTWLSLDGILDTKSYWFGFIIGSVSQATYWVSYSILEDEPRESR